MSKGHIPITTFQNGLRLQQVQLPFFQSSVTHTSLSQVQCRRNVEQACEGVDERARRLRQQRNQRYRRTDVDARAAEPIADDVYAVEDVEIEFPTPEPTEPTPSDSDSESDDYRIPTPDPTAAINTGRRLHVSDILNPDSDSESGSDPSIEATEPPPQEDDAGSGSGDSVVEVDDPRPTCAICIQPVRDFDFCVTNCRHHFHQSCMITFLFRTRTRENVGDTPCPICRKQMMTLAIRCAICDGIVDDEPSQGNFPRKCQPQKEMSRGTAFTTAYLQFAQASSKPSPKYQVPTKPTMRSPSRNISPSSPPTSRAVRQYDTTVNYRGFAYTRSYVGATSDSYRCSVYRSTACRARLTIAKGANRSRSDGVTMIREHTCVSNAAAPLASRPVSERLELASVETYVARDDATDLFAFDDRTSAYEQDDDERSDCDDERAGSTPVATPCGSTPPAASQSTGSVASESDSVCIDENFIEVINATAIMEEETDRLAMQLLNKTPLAIWDLINEEFYQGHTNEISHGLTKEQVVSRVKRIRSEHFGGDKISQLKNSSLAFVKGTKQAYVQFINSFFENGELQYVIGLAHPALMKLLNYRRTALFVDGTFKSVPRSFYQCLVVMVYDEATDMYVPVFHVLLTGKSEMIYSRALAAIKTATGGKIDPSTVTCEFELALHNVVKTHFSDASLVGCFFHWKQAIRRWLLKNKMPEDEVSLALGPGYLDKLTVVPHHQIVDKAVPWIKQRLSANCRRKKIGYSTAIWEKFWDYFSATWMRRFGPSNWNYTKVDGVIVNRTNNPLERYNRTMNSFFPGAHPSLATFVSVIEEQSRKTYRNLVDIQAGRARAPTHASPYVPETISFN